MEEPLEGGGHGRGSRMTKQPASAHRKKNAESCLSRSTVRSVSWSVRTGHRFIHQQQLGILGDEHGDLKPLFLAVGQAAGLALGGTLAQMPRGRPQRRLVHLDRLREPPRLAHWIEGLTAWGWRCAAVVARPGGSAGHQRTDRTGAASDLTGRAGGTAQRGRVGASLPLPGSRHRVALRTTHSKHHGGWRLPASGAGRGGRGSASGPGGLRWPEGGGGAAGPRR